MTKRRIDTHIKNVTPFVHELQQAAYADGWRAGARARLAQIVTLIEDVDADADIVDFILVRVRTLPEPTPASDESGA